MPEKLRYAALEIKQGLILSGFVPKLKVFMGACAIFVVSRF